MTNNLNETNSTESEPYIRWKQADWIIPEVINSLLIVATLWIIFSLIHFGIKHKKWSTNRMGNADKLSGGSVYTLTVVCAITALVRFINSQFAFNIGIGVGYDKECEIVSDSSFAWYSLVNFAVFIFLWLRQRIFYANNMLNVRFGILLKILSFSSIVILFLSGLATVLVNTIPVNFPSSREGCIYHKSENIGPIAWIVGIMVVIAGQFVLLGLFIYPLKRDFVQSICGCCPSAFHVWNTNRNKSSSVSSIQTRNSSFQSSNTVKSIMQRTIAFSIIAVAAHIIIILISSYAISSEGHRRVSTVVFDINAFFNVIFVICSFLSCKQMLFSPVLNENVTLAQTSSDIARSN
ncbi:uncharacterized protein LOC143452154 [Clavelina lepadiformis]|uniref:uncharacterized protein LOC143452154 n=1 Tax=Clavelina lepadiformis TaxID=159417 RepID=UPI0040415D7C